MLTDDQDVSVVSSELKKESRLPVDPLIVYSDGRRRDDRSLLINGKGLEVPNKPLLLEVEVELYLVDIRQL